MIKKVALFDFDNTVATGDSIVRLLNYDLSHHPLHIFHFISVAYHYCLYLLHITSIEKVKSALLFPLRYMNEDDFRKFYKEYVEIYYYDNVVKVMQEKKDEGYEVVLCTASVEAYMKYNQLPIDKLLGTRTIPHTSQIIGKNCKDEEKVLRILEYLKSQDIEIDYENSYAYSDSRHDIPMLSLVKHKKRVLLKTGEIVDFIV